ncbi:MAG: hypothetical protein WD981_02645 [Gaiellaceae bacterium]
MTTLAHHPLPAVQTYETDDELVVEVELPAGEPLVKAELKGRILKLTIARPPRHPAWEAHPDVASP